MSFDNVKVGQLQGQGLVDCTHRREGCEALEVVELKGAPTDNNATLFAQGYDGVLDPLYAAGRGQEARRAGCAELGFAQAGPIFENLLTAGGGKADGVIAANDGMGQ